MSNTLQFVAMVALLLFVALMAALLQPEWSRDLGLDPVSLTTWERDLFGDPQLAQPNREALQRAAAKDHVEVALIEGRLTLFEAAAHFRRLNDPQLDLRSVHRGDSEEERLCRQVIQVAKPILRIRGQESVTAEFTTRWEEELRRHLEQHGEVILPDVTHIPDRSANAFPSR